MAGSGSMQKRGTNSWRLTVSCGYTDEGKQITKRKTVTARTKTEAKKLLNEFVHEVNSGKYINNKMTFINYAKYWISSISSELQPKTLHFYQETINKRLIPELGQLKLEEIRPTHILDLYEKLRSPNARKDGKTGGLAPQTILHIHSLLLNLFKSAVNWNLMLSNPVAQVRRPKVDKYTANVYFPEEVELLMKCLNEESYVMQILVILAVATGARLGELMGLDWNYVNIEEKYIEIVKTRQYVPKRGQFEKLPKTKNSIRSLPIPDKVIEKLNEYRAYWLATKAKFGDRWKAGNNLFFNYAGNSLSPGYASSWFPKFIKKHALPKIRFHDLRHTLATRLLHENVDIVTVSKQMGHSRPGTSLNIYGHPRRPEMSPVPSIIGTFLNKGLDSLNFKSPAINEPSNSTSQ